MSELHDAVEAGDLPRVKKLLKEGAKPDAENKWHQTPLQAAVFGGAGPEILEALIAAGASVETSHDPPLICAAADGNVEAVRVLLEADADPGVRCGERDNETPLHFAVYRNDLPCVKLLLSHGGDPDEPNAEGETPLDAAKRKGLQGLVAFIEEHR